MIKFGLGASDQAVGDAIKWIIARQNADGGWGFKKDDQSRLFPTCFALVAMFRAFMVARSNDSIRASLLAGLALLTKSFRQEDGSFGDVDRLQGVHTTCAVLVLQAARRASLGQDGEMERDALVWLMRHPDRARSLEEEWIEIDSDPSGDANYPFLFMTEASLLMALVEAEADLFTASELARGTLLVLKDKFDDRTGGFYGYRVFTWSTARALSALTIAKTKFKDFPSRKSEIPETTAVNSRLAAASILLVAFVAVLVFSWAKATDLIVLALFGMTVLAVVLAMGYIKEATFKDLFATVSSQGKPDAKSDGGD